MLHSSMIGCPKMIYVREVHSAQTVHLSCAKTNTISKRTKTSFPLTYITLEYHSGVRKPISMPEVHSRKPGTYLSPRLILSQYELKQASTRHTLPRSTIRVCPKRFPCTWYIRRKPCTYLTPKLILSQNRPKQASTRHTLPRSTIRVCPKRFPCTWYIRCKLCTYLATRLILSPNGSKQVSS